MSESLSVQLATLKAQMQALKESAAKSEKNICDKLDKIECGISEAASKKDTLENRLDKVESDIGWLKRLGAGAWTVLAGYVSFFK